MKKIIRITAILALILTAASCEQDLPVFNDQTARLNFVRDYTIMNEDMEESYSFVYHGDIKQDTVWVRLSTMGLIRNYDRHFELEQVESADTVNAVAGKHYVPFDQMKEFYVIPAGANEVKVPVILLRDASLKTDRYLLKFRLKETDIFKRGYASVGYRKIIITDKLEKPISWTTNELDYYIAPYSTSLHKFIIDITGETWDNDYITKVCEDPGFLNYIGGWLKNKLAEVNAERASQGLEPLKNEDGTPLKITPFGRN